jgi:hydrogenase maturation protease
VRVRVIGIGSPHGDDGAGLAAAERLASAPLPHGVSVRLCARPLPDLLEQVQGAEALLIVDATRSGRAAGTVHRVTRDSIAEAAATSSHGVGVAAALELAEALHGAVRHVELVGIEAGERRFGAMSAPVAAAIAEAAALLRARACELAAPREEE